MRHTSRRTRALVAAALVAGIAAPIARAAVPPVPQRVDLTAAGRDTEPVILTGASFPQWAKPAEVTLKAPSTAGVECMEGNNTCSHNQYEEPEVATGETLGTGVPVQRLLGYRWDATAARFEQIPFQVDEIAVRYLSNNASTFSFYSQVDQHATYVYDQERFNWTKEDPADPCNAISALANGAQTTPDTVTGLDTDDELVFMAGDAGPQAPSTAAKPADIAAMHEVVLTDPITRAQTYAYVMLASEKGPAQAFTAANGAVRYLPDADSDTFLYSQSSYGSYGNTFKGAWYDAANERCVTDQPKQHRPKDTAWIKTPRYAYRYDGRWVMNETRVATPLQEAANKAQPDATKWTYGPDLVDQWKARAFQQRPGGETPCCGYEEEVNNWGGSSILMGVRAGPVRTIRVTWGADSSTNNIRAEVFYAAEMRQLNNLRVHVIPPADGIYAQWDFNAGKMTTYYNPYRPDGVTIDGQNDEVFGNSKVYAGQDGASYQADDKTGVAPLDEQVNAGIGTPHGNRCPNDACVNNDIDTYDPTLSGPDGTLNWEQTSGPFGTFVDRTTVRQVTAGAAYSITTTPYYRDDACFDDGTGMNPGPHVKARSVDPTVDSLGAPRACWKPSDGDPAATSPADHFYQGSIGTHGVHILLIAESDNAAMTQPLTEISSETRRVILPGNIGNVGERYGRSTEKPLVATVVPKA